MGVCSRTTTICPMATSTSHTCIIATCGGRQKHFLISGASQAHFGSFKDLYQRRYYFREQLYSQTSLKAWDSEEKLVFSSRLPLRRHIGRLATYPIDPGIVISLYVNAHHLYTTLATGEWMIFWPSEDSLVEVGSTECSRHLVFPVIHACKVATTISQQPYNQYVMV